MIARKASVVFALILGGAVFSWWFGEDPYAPMGTNLLLALWLILFIALEVITFLVLGRPRKLVGVAGCLGVAIILPLGFVGGSKASTRAFNECVAVGETVRDRLAEYRSTHGFFPGELSELPGKLPCQRPLRGTLLEYAPRGRDSYGLHFGDWLVTHEATEKDPFMARK